MFPTDAMPVSADLLNHALHQLQRRGRIERRLVRLPASIAGADVARVYADLARLNRFSDVVLDGRLAPAERRRLIERLRYYQPAVKVGAVGEGTAVPDVDFTVVEVEPDAAALQTRAQSLLRSGTPTYFLLQRAPTTEDARLFDAMRVLRAAGVRHYGYLNDDFLGNSPELLRTVTELRAHTIITAETANRGAARR
jgi:hypothetical protein